MGLVKNKAAAKPKNASTIGINGLDAGSEQAFRDFMSEIYAAAATLQTLRRITARPYGLTSTELAVMLAVAKLEDRPSVRRIADYLHISASNVTADVGKLVRRRLLRKLPDPADARAIKIELTEKGSGLIVAIAPALRAVNDRLYSDMTRDEMAIMTKLLKHVVLEGTRLIEQHSQEEN